MTLTIASRTGFTTMRRTLLALALVASGSATLAQTGAPLPRDGAGVVFTADERGQSISVVNPVSGKVETNRVGISPHNIQASSDGLLLYAVGMQAG